MSTEGSIFETMTEALIDLLSDVSHRFQVRLRAEAEKADFGLTAFETKALVTIARLPGSTQQAIAARIGCDKGQLARAIKGLEARGLIERQTSASDWRASDLGLTTAGQAIFVDLQRRRDAIARDCLAKVGAEDRQRLAVILSTMRDGLKGDV
ncbi:hypothetical protein BH10PSE3_BH10PSE3_05960 [soil metagenome]